MKHYYETLKPIDDMAPTAYAKPIELDEWFQISSTWVVRIPLVLRLLETVRLLRIQVQDLQDFKRHPHVRVRHSDGFYICCCACGKVEKWESMNEAAQKGDWHCGWTSYLRDMCDPCYQRQLVP